MSVGNLPPQQSVVLKLGYVTELEVENDTVIFSLFPYLFSGYPILRSLFYLFHFVSFCFILSHFVHLVFF
jgi:hypothetical protein